MPGPHGCKKLCVGCQLRVCGRHCGSDNPWGDSEPHICEHCHTLFADWEMTLVQLRFEVTQIRRAHAAKLERAANAARRVRTLAQQRGG